jgi:hypothetical protein
METVNVIGIPEEWFKSPDAAVRLKAYRMLSDNEHNLRGQVSRRTELEIHLLEECLHTQSSHT